MKVRIYVARRLHTFSPIQARALAVADGVVAALGKVGELRARWPHAEMLDLGDVTITPGLVDSHIHLTEWAVARKQIDLTSAQSLTEAVRLIAEHPAARHERWVFGRGWNPHLWGGAYPTRALLDNVLPDRPAMFQSHDMHALWVNTRALERAGITRSTPDPDGGRIVRDEQGEPTGALLENAAQLLVPHLPRLDTARLQQAIDDAQRELHGYGITAAHSLPGVHLRTPDPLPVLQNMRAAGRLKLRILQHVALDYLDDMITAGVRSGFGDDWLRIGGVKMFLDGALGSRTALMFEPYEKSQDRGLEVLAAQDFRATVARAARQGIASVVHAIGDAAVARALAVLKDPQLQTGTLPHRVEHVQCLPPVFAALITPRVICSMQPAHLITDWRAADQHWGNDRASRTYALRALLDAGAIIAFGSDAPVEPADPRLGLFAATARQDTEHQPAGGWHTQQRITAREALAGYTVGAAAAAGAAAYAGRIAPGMLADFAIWRQDPLSIAPPALLKLEVVATVIAGDVVFEN